MTTIVIGAATASISSPAITLLAAAARVRQWVKFAGSTCESASRRLHLAVSDWKEALEHQLQEFVLELLAAIVVIAIILIVTDPATRNDPDAGESGVRSSP
jgi:glycerol uptake facilitator-like aquaporin